MNGNRKRKKPDAVFNQWLRERDEAVASLDLSKFKAFILKWQARGAYKIKQLPPDHILSITQHKMACEIRTIPEEIGLKAAQWLVEHGYIAGVEWGKNDETEDDGK